MKYFIWKKIWQDKLHFSKKTPPKSPHLLGLSLIVGRILLLCIASIKKRRQCAQNWTFDNTGNTIVFVIESQVAGTKDHLNIPGMADPNLLSPFAIPENNCHFFIYQKFVLYLFYSLSCQQWRVVLTPLIGAERKKRPNTFQKWKAVIAFTNSNTVPRIFCRFWSKTITKQKAELSNSPVKTCYVCIWNK